MKPRWKAYDDEKKAMVQTSSSAKADFVQKAKEAAEAAAAAAAGASSIQGVYLIFLSSSDFFLSPLTCGACAPFGRAADCFSAIYLLLS